jgi:glycosyltransferase involved in cell wall biosynthesis
LKKFSIIVPVYNRPIEVDELLQSLTLQEYKDFEIIIVEDGSSISCEEVCLKYKAVLDLHYFYKENTGPGLSRNFGADKATGDYLIFFDSDCIIPDHYLAALHKFLQNNHADAFGGPDRAHDSFSSIQKAINYSMTSFITTGGIRGGKKSMENFKPRSFNMGFSREVYQATKGYSSIRFGEDIDLSLRIEKAGFKSMLVEAAWVYHKRRTDFRKFYKQVFNSGIARVVLHKLHPGSLKLVHLLPGVFAGGLAGLITLSVLIDYLFLLPLLLFAGIILVDALFQYKNKKVAFFAVLASFVQLIGYGTGFFWGVWRILLLKKRSYYAFEESFYK